MIKIEVISKIRITPSKLKRAKFCLGIILFIYTVFAFVFSNRILAVGSMTQLAIFTGEGTGTHFANSIGHKNTVVIEDINNDGVDDLIVGARHYDPGGGAYIFLGKTNLTDTNAVDADVILREPNEPSVFGATISVGDINRDGVLELAISDYNHQLPVSYAGGTFFFTTGSSFSSRNSDRKDFKITGTVSDTKSGSPTEIIGDVNGDGYADVLYNGVSNKFYLFYGSSTFSDKTVTNADVVFDFTNDNMCPLSPPRFLPNVDLNSDGYKDIVIGCKYAQADNPLDTAGRIYIYFGSLSLTNKTDTEADVIISPASGSEAWEFGVAVAIDDINNDGKNDLITKENYDKIYIYWGRENWESLTTSQADATIIPDPNDQEISPGWGLGGGLLTFNINNDGVADLITSDSVLGRTYVFYGGSDFTNMNTSQADLIFNTSGASNGALIFSAGNLNNNGYADLAISDHNYNESQGAVYVVEPPHGSPNVQITTTGLTNEKIVRGTASDSLPIGGVETSVDNGSWIACLASDGSFNSASENYICNITSLLESSHSVRVRSFNNNGVYMPSTTYTTGSFVYDSTPPDSPDLDQLGALVFNPSATHWYLTGAKPVFSGTAEPSSIVTLIIGSTSVTITVDANGNWSYQPQDPLDTNNYTVTLFDTDLAGNESNSWSFALTIDPTMNLFPESLREKFASTGGGGVNEDTGETYTEPAKDVTSDDTEGNDQPQTSDTNTQESTSGNEHKRSLISTIIIGTYLISLLVLVVLAIVAVLKEKRSSRSK